ncbi:MAG: hypothetical protein CL846_03875 [Crocinitomicaceae bacterium]|nr:hypothetical protein [Crocinitomicaceae bacterium]|tara:strand:- start:5963 stop:6544 length:582 start_codon:yes stop_codon:yes gene_type:complete
MDFLKTLNTLIAFALSTFILLNSCKKTIDDGGIKTGGCTDINSPFYDSIADYDDASCTYAYINQYEITYYPEINPNATWPFTSWDITGTGADADLELKIIEYDSSNYFFSSPVIDNQSPNSPCFWTSSNNEKLYNKRYHWEIYDRDAGPLDNDFIDSGSFNPILIGVNGKVTTFGKHPPENRTQLVLHYEIGT